VKYWLNSTLYQVGTGLVPLVSLAMSITHESFENHNHL
jgi:hypothetical protein